MKHRFVVNRKDAQRLLGVGLLWALNLGGEAAPARPEDPMPVPPPDAEVSALKAEVRDRGWIAYSAQSGQGDWDLFVMRPDGSARRNLTETRASNEAGAKFSSDGKRLLYYRMPKAEPLDRQ